MKSMGHSARSSNRTEHQCIPRAALNRLEESVDVIMDWPVNLADLSVIEVLWAILKKLVRRTQPKTIDELKSALVAP
jgi:hypothetical protein